jgi:hypothetical protein
MVCVTAGENMVKIWNGKSNIGKLLANTEKSQICLQKALDLTSNSNDLRKRVDKQLGITDKI